MKLTFKTLQQAKFELDVESTATMGEVKKLIHETQGYEIEHQKLIYSGKILVDSMTVDDYKIKEKDFIVCMVTKPKAAPSTTISAAPSVSAPVSSSETKPSEAKEASAPSAKPATAAPASTDSSSTAQASSGATATIGDSSGFATGPAYQSAVQNLVEMGFEKPQVVRAMKAAFNNPDRAAEYLMTGIPEHLQRDEGSAAGQQSAAASQGAAPPPSETQGAAATQGATESGDYINLFDAAAAQQRSSGRDSAGAGTDPLAILRNSPQFHQMRQMIQNNPEHMQPLLQQLMQTDPQLVQSLMRNPAQLVQLLAEGDEGSEESGGAEGAEQFIQVTPEENEAITRLTALGFDRNMAIQAFFACDKNEDLAANYLFDHGQNDW